MRRQAVGFTLLVAAVGLAAPAPAQTTSDRPEYLWSIERSLWRGPSVGEQYTLELSGGLWDPRPSLVATSDRLGILGSTIDFGQDLGLRRARHPEFRLTLKPGRRHKLRVALIPIEYAQQHVLQRRLVFQGVTYDVGLPVTSTLRWDAWRLGYEFDVVARERGYLGLILEAKYTHLQAELTSPLVSEYVRARAPIPAIGAIARVYPSRFTPITVELTAFTIPERLTDEYRARYIDLDIYATLNLSRMVGVNLGYRSLDFNYLIDSDTADLKLDGLYLSGTVRF